MPSILLPIIISETEPWSCLCSVEDCLQLVNNLHYLQCHTLADTQVSLTQQACSPWQVCHHTHRQMEAEVSCPCSPPPSQRCGLLDPWQVFSFGHLVSEVTAAHPHGKASPEALQGDLHGMSPALPVDQKVKMAHFGAGAQLQVQRIFILLTVKHQVGGGKLSLIHNITAVLWNFINCAPRCPFLSKKHNNFMQISVPFSTVFPPILEFSLLSPVHLMPSSSVWLETHVISFVFLNVAHGPIH